MKIKFSFLAIIIVLATVLFSVNCRFTGSSSPESNSNTTAVKSESSESNSSSSGKSSQNIPAICQNAYYPVGPTVERKYHVSYAKDSFPAQDYTEKYSDFNGDKFVAKTDFKDVGTTINWICTPEGLLATQYVNSIDFKNGGGSKIDTINSRGVSFPSESRWNVGEKWTTDYDVKETLKNPSGQQT